MRRVVVFLVALCGMLAVVPAAQAIEPLPYASLTPADGTSIVAQQYGVAWQLTGGPQDGFGTMTVRVSSSTALGSDGVTLSDMNQVDLFLMRPSATDVGVWRGTSNTYWTNRPGTYYWQIQSQWGHSGDFHNAASRIFKLVITAAQEPAPPDLTMTTAAARTELRAMINNETGRSARDLHYRCTRTSYRAFRCRPNWSDSRFIYIGTATLRHYVAEDGQVYFAGTFRGKRASSRCLKRRSVRACARAFRWG